MGGGGGWGWATNNFDRHVNLVSGHALQVAVRFNVFVSVR